jgi:hypothetical protein
MVLDWVKGCAKISLFAKSSSLLFSKLKKAKSLIINDLAFF